MIEYRIERQLSEISSTGSSAKQCSNGASTGSIGRI